MARIRHGPRVLRESTAPSASQMEGTLLGTLPDFPRGSRFPPCRRAFQWFRQDWKAAGRTLLPRLTPGWYRTVHNWNHPGREPGSLPPYLLYSTYFLWLLTSAFAIERAPQTRPSSSLRIEFNLHVQVADVHPRP